MSSNPIIITVNDSIAPSIAPNLKAIETNARSADASIQSLKQSLDAINASGVGSLSRSLSTISNSTSKLVQATNSMSVAALNASTNIDKMTVSYDNLSTAISRVVGLLQTYGNVISNANRNTVPFVQTVKQAGAGTRGTVTDVMAASAAIRGLEGNFGTSVRAGERFLVNILGMGPILRAAFPIFGALAFAGILDILGEHVTKLIDVFKRMKGSITDVENAAILAGDKIIKLQSSGFFSAANFSKLLIGDTTPNQDITIQNAQTALKELQWKRELAVAQADVNEKGLQGLALQKQKVIDTQLEKKLMSDEQIQVQNLANSYKSLLEQTHQVIQKANPDQPEDIVTNVRNITDPKQIKAVQDQMQTAQQAANQLGHEIDMVGVKIDGLKKHEAIVGMKDDIKAAREQMKTFENEMSNLKQQDHVVSPQEKLKLLQDQASRSLPLNDANIQSQIGTVNQQIERQGQLVDNIVSKLKDQNEEIGVYSDKLKEEQQWSKIEQQLRKDDITLTQDQTKQIKDLIAANVESVDFQKELRQVYTEFDEPLRRYNASLKAITQLEQDGVITHNQALIALNESKRAYTDATQPLAEYTHGLQNEVDLLGKFGDELTVATEVQRVNETIRQKGRQLTDSETQSLTNYLRTLNQQKQIQQEVNKLYQQFGQELIKTALAENALNEANKKGIITDEQYAVASAKLRVEQAQLAVEMQKMSKTDLSVAVFGSYIKNFEGFTKETTKLYQNMFTSIADGAADALGRAIAFGENLGDALKNVAREALAELISGFIKIGIQMLITKIIGEAATNSTVVQAAIAGTAVAEAWAPAAAMVSLASFGANATPAIAGIATTTALAELLAVAHFNKGGIVPGFGNSDTVPAMLTPGEGVLNQRAMKTIGVDTLRALNNGSASIRSGASSIKGSGFGGLNVNVIHDGSTSVEVQQINENQVQIIAKREADKAVQEKTPQVVSSQISNPNSPISKAIQRNTTARRNR